MFKFLFVLVFSMFSCLAFAQDIVPMPTSEFIKMFLESLGGLKGATTLAVIGIVLKILFAFLHSELSGKLGFMKNLEPGVKLFIILLISYSSGVIGLMTVGGLSFGAAFIHSTSMSALVVLLNQAYKKFIEKKK